MSSRLLLVLFLLVVGSAVALASLPCKSREEAMAEAVSGFFLVQDVAAARCDESLGGKAYRGLHDKIRALYKPQIEQAHRTRNAYFVRAYGIDGEKERMRVDALMTDLLGAALVANPETCGQLKTELKRRHAGGWEPILKRLERRVEAIAAEDKNVCQS